MILKTILGYFFDANPHLSLVLDIILTILILNTRNIKLILFYFTLVILNVILELYIRQISILSESKLTAQNIERLENQDFELHSNVRLAI